MLRRTGVPLLLRHHVSTCRGLEQKLFPTRFLTCVRLSSSNARWKTRQGSDMFAREAKVQGLKSRAAFKLLEVAHPGPMREERGFPG